MLRISCASRFFARNELHVKPPLNRGELHTNIPHEIAIFMASPVTFTFVASPHNLRFTHDSKQTIYGIYAYSNKAHLHYIRARSVGGEKGILSSVDAKCF